MRRSPVRRLEENDVSEEIPPHVLNVKKVAEGA